MTLFVFILISCIFATPEIQWRIFKDIVGQALLKVGKPTALYGPLQIMDSVDNAMAEAGLPARSTEKASKLRNCAKEIERKRRENINLFYDVNRNSKADRKMLIKYAEEVGLFLPADRFVFINDVDVIDIYFYINPSPNRMEAQMFENVHGEQLQCRVKNGVFHGFARWSGSRQWTAFREGRTLSAEEAKTWQSEMENDRRERTAMQNEDRMSHDMRNPEPLLQLLYEALRRPRTADAEVQAVVETRKTFSQTPAVVKPALADTQMQTDAALGMAAETQTETTHEVQQTQTDVFTSDADVQATWDCNSTETQTEHGDFEDPGEPHYINVLPEVPQSPFAMFAVVKKTFFGLEFDTPPSPRLPQRAKSA